jgi:hypothetical protein
LAVPVCTSGFLYSRQCVLALFRGAATLVIGLATSIKNRIGQASGLDKFILFGPLCFAISMAIFGAVIHFALRERLFPCRSFARHNF